MRAQATAPIFADDEGRKRVNNALDERLQAWAEWSEAGKPVKDLGLPTRSTLANIKELHLTDAPGESGHTATARQSTVPRMLSEEQFVDEEITERAVSLLNGYSPIHAAVIRAEYLSMVPVLHKPPGEVGTYVIRRLRADRKEGVNAYRRRKAQALSRSLQRYLQLLSEARVGLALQIDLLDEGWISAASEASK